MSPLGTTTYRHCIELRQAFEAVLDQLIVPECVVVDHPTHKNLGDHIIALATYLYLLDRKVCVREITSVHEMPRYDDCPIVMHGGGNLGDLWPAHETYRQELVARFPDRELLIFPQSVFFQRPEAARQAARAYNSHGGVTILVREAESLKIARDLFHRCRVTLCPDAAFYLSEHVKVLQNDLFLAEGQLIRGDGRLAVVQMEASSQVESKPWGRTVFRITRQLETLPGNLPLTSLSLTLAAMLQLSQCKCLVTERLHGHILACLMGIPNTLLPVQYHKNRSTFETWTKRLPNTAFRIAPHPAP